MRKLILFFSVFLVLTSCKDSVQQVYPLGYKVTLDDIKKSEQVFKTSKWSFIKMTLYNKAINDSQTYESFYIIVDSLTKVCGYIYNAPYIESINGDSIKCSFLYGDYRQYYNGEPYKIPKMNVKDIPMGLKVDCNFKKRYGDIFVDSIFTIEHIELGDSVSIHYSSQNLDRSVENPLLPNRCSYFQLHKLYFELEGSRPYIYVFKDTSYTSTNRFYFKKMNQKELFTKSLCNLYN